MDNPPTAPTAPSFELGDIYYTLFRHKWKILSCSLAGLAAAFAAYKVLPPSYQSEAKLFIRYVIAERQTLGPGRDDTITKSPDQRGETIIKSELEILTSMDLAEVVVKNVGAERILGPAHGNNPVDAAIVIQHNLLVEVPPNSSVIQIRFQHRDPSVVQVVLRELVASYLKKHNEVHQAVGMVGDFLTQETDQLRGRLAQTEEELRKATNMAGIVSLEDYKKSTGEHTARLREQILNLQAELAERTSIYEAMTHGANAIPSSDEAAPAPVPAAQVEAFQKVAVLLALLRQREQAALTQFTEESPPVLEIRTQITAAAEQKKQLESDFPALGQLHVATPASTQSATPAAPEFNPALEAAKINALQAKFKVLTNQMEEIRKENFKVDQLEISILELRRQKELQEANYRYYAANLEQSRINEALGTGRVSNISQIETPTPPAKDIKKVYKLIAGIAAAGVAFGLGWAFVVEFYFDRTVRRPGDVEQILRLPLFLSIPKFSRTKLAMSAPPLVQHLAGPAAEASAPASELALDRPARTQVALDPYHETLRDRLISYFESINLRHKPKLVAVTGLGKDSGVTTTAAGLARSLSEIGEGNVLLVDMTQGQGSAQHFHKGASVALDQLLETKGRDSAQVQDNLFVVTEASSSARLAKGMPQRFSQLIPKLKTSDFDYIIFDMPSVSQISITPRLAGFMDMVLLVIESEKTDRQVVQRATDLLAQSKAKVGAVLNKTKHYVPKRLHQDREFLLGT